jgi:hypothetical protein
MGQPGIRRLPFGVLVGARSPMPPQEAGLLSAERRGRTYAKCLGRLAAAACSTADNGAIKLEVEDCLRCR